MDDSCRARVPHSAADSKILLILLHKNHNLSHMIMKQVLIRVIGAYCKQTYRKMDNQTESKKVKNCIYVYIFQNCTCIYIHIYISKFFKVLHNELQPTPRLHVAARVRQSFNAMRVYNKLQLAGHLFVKPIAAAARKRCERISFSPNSL